jgi:acetylornithine deacetylase/succinyl-diaminopimelate desuccinylase-like protein
LGWIVGVFLASLVGCAPLAPVAEAPPPAPVVAPDSTVATLARRDDVSRALKHIERHRYTGLSELIELTQIPAPPFAEAARGVRFSELLAATEFGPVHTDDVGNVIAVRPGRRGGRIVAVVAHLDTVFPVGTDVRVRVEGTRYSAPGIGDNTRGLVLLLELARAMVAADLRADADIWLVGNVGEEGLGDLRGVRHLYRDGAPVIDSLIAIDGGDAGRIVTDGVGSNRFRVTFTGPGGHSWGDFGLANPHHALGSAIDLFTRRAGEVVASGPAASFNVGRIGGGTSVNSIAFESWMEVDMRSVSEDKLAELTAVLEESMRDAAHEHNDIRRQGDALGVMLKPIGRRPAGGVDRSTPLVMHATDALRLVGVEPSYVASSTDANIPMSLGLAGITLSRGGRSTRAHSLDESWEDINTHLSTQAALLTVLADARLSDP